jgi:hypothetical protein
MIETAAAIETPVELKRRVNEELRGDRVVPRWSEAERIAFFCECASETCYQADWLTCRDYDLARARPGWAALIDGHRGQVSSG